MKEFVEKLIGRLEECLKQEKRNLYSYIEEGFGYSQLSDAFNDGETLGAFNAYSDMLDFIKELAEEYNNGWIPCSERLPKFPKNYEDEKCYLTTVRRKDGYVFWDIMVFHDYGWYLPSNCEVIAWKEVEPYQKGDGE